MIRNPPPKNDNNNLKIIYIYIYIYGKSYFAKITQDRTFGPKTHEFNTKIMGHVIGPPRLWVSGLWP